MQIFGNRTLHILNKTIDDEPVCACIMNFNHKNKMLSFSNYNVRMFVFFSYKNLRHLLVTHRLRDTELILALDVGNKIEMAMDRCFG